MNDPHASRDFPDEQALTGLPEMAKPRPTMQRPRILSLMLAMLAATTAAGPRAQAGSPAPDAGTQLPRDWSLPTHVDLRDYFFPPRDQGDRQTCAAFAATGLMEFLLRMHTNRATALSEEWSFAQGRKIALADPFLGPMYRKVDGLPGFLAVKAFETASVAQDAWKYSTRKLPEGRISPRTPKDLEFLPYTLKTEFIPRHEIGEFLLRENRPVVMNIWWYFGSVNDRGDFKMPSAQDVAACRDEAKGCQGHTVLFVGYDAETKRLLFRNSWGPRWGVGGYGSMPEAYVREHCEACYSQQWPGLTDDEYAYLVLAAQGVTGSWPAKH